MIRIKGTILHGLIGDLYAFNGLSFSPRLDGTIDYSPPREIYTDDLSFSPRIKGGMIYSDEQGHLYIPVPMINIRFDGIVDIQGALHFQLPILGVEMSGYASAEGVLDITIPRPLVKFTGQQEISGVLNILLPRREFVASGVINENGVLNITIPTVSFSGSVESEIGIGLTVEIPMIRVHMDGYSSVEGDLDITIPMILFHMEQSAEAADYLTMVMNIRNKALTTFDNYNFNSMCAFGGRHFGATGANIFDLDTGDKDNGVPIEWNFKTGYLDLEQKSKKKLVQAWTSYKTDGDIKFTLVQPDGGQYEYILQGIDTTETGLRVKFGKGIKTKYVALNISNIDGSSIDLDELKLHLATSTFVKVR